MFNMFPITPKRKRTEETMDQSKALKPEMEGFGVNQVNNDRTIQLQQYVRFGSRDELNQILEANPNIDDDRKAALDAFIDKLLGILRELKAPLRTRTLSTALLKLEEHNPQAVFMLNPEVLFPVESSDEDSEASSELDEEVTLSSEADEIPTMGC